MLVGVLILQTKQGSLQPHLRIAVDLDYDEGVNDPRCLRSLGMQLPYGEQQLVDHQVV